MNKSISKDDTTIALEKSTKEPSIQANMSMSLDGFIAGPNIGLENPMGEGGERLHEWMFPPKGDYQQVAAEMFKNVGAVFMGRRMFDLGEEPWGDEPPFHLPVFVLTHTPRRKVVKQGGTTFAFVTDGLVSTIEQAKTAAGDKDVLVAGGANVVQQTIKAGILDEINIHLVPVLLGRGTPLVRRPGTGANRAGNNGRDNAPE
jgi:dihydrofolate reductase